MLTPEREKEIREHWVRHHYNPASHVEDLLAEIDRLRNDYRNSLSDTVKVLKDCDKLREERDGLYGDLIGQEHRLGLRCEMAEKERDQLREKLAVAIETLEKIDLNCNSNMGIASFSVSAQCFRNLITSPKEWIAEALAKIRLEK
jgi:hypothetical protein